MESRLTVPLLRVAGFPVRMHLLLPAMFVLWVVTTPSYARPGVLLVLFGFLGVMTVSILLHELGHAFAARREGLGVHGILLWPLGGLTYHEEARSTGSELRVTLAGVGVNLVLALLAGGAYWASAGEAPGLPRLEGSRNWLLAVWNLNAALFVLNLLPGHPFDGGHAVEALLARKHGRRRARVATFVTGAVIGAGLLVGGLSRQDAWLSVLGGWCLMSVVGAWRALRQESMENEALLGVYDFSNGYTSLEKGAPKPPPRESRAAARRRERERLEAEAREAAAAREAVDSKARLDGLLDRIASDGISSLTAEERSFLNEQSRRLRDRGRSPTRP